MLFLIFVILLQSWIDIKHVQIIRSVYVKVEASPVFYSNLRGSQLGESWLKVTVVLKAVELRLRMNRAAAPNSSI